ncbi:hypothetical protein PHMEG_00011892 [Phytophthora megakarya]|uniref:Secreted protein n=1 Tax=Phytophthora megakarya TaxID=4795 RepID=A0A225WC92_9STRA|nr:hypothetical protein PHMEG_00011892 [Phytophthora megakarya]
MHPLSLPIARLIFCLVSLQRHACPFAEQVDVLVLATGIRPQDVYRPVKKLLEGSSFCLPCAQVKLFTLRWSVHSIPELRSFASCSTAS